MRFAIVANPAAGGLTRDQKERALRGPARILGARVHGLETEDAGEFRQVVRRLSLTHDVVVVAGGDGTLFHALNAVPPRSTILAYLPLGSGNSLRYALQYPRGHCRVARRILHGRTRALDLIVCDGGRKTLFASLGVEGAILGLATMLRRRSMPGPLAYVLGTLRVLSAGFSTPSALIRLPGETLRVPRLTTLVVTKQPYYGFGLRVVPRARTDDGVLHFLVVKAALPSALSAAALSPWVPLPLGRYRSAGRVEILLDRPIRLQTMGEPAWRAARFTFRVDPGALLMRC